MMATPSRAVGHPRPSPGSGAETTGRARGSEQARAPGRTCAGRLSSCSGTILEFSMIMETALPHMPKGAKVRTIPKSKIRPREPAFGWKWGQMSLEAASIDRTSVLGADFGIALERRSGPFFVVIERRRPMRSGRPRGRRCLHEARIGTRTTKGSPGRAAGLSHESTGDASIPRTTKGSPGWAAEHVHAALHTGQ